MKKCPACAEEIQDEAIKCKHCGEMLNKFNQMGNSIIEKILVEEHPVWDSYIWVLPVILFLVISIFLGSIGSIYFLVIICLIIFVHRNSIRFIITNKKVIVEKALLGKNREEIDIQHIRGIKASKSPFFNFGKILIATSAGEYEIVIKGIAKPLERGDMIKKLQSSESV